MQPRATRYWLRFESGPREGETVPLSEGLLSVGRRSANKIVVADGSISGFHAELQVGPDSVEVKDLDSTNGVRVGNTKVGQATVAHGDVVTFGSIAATLVDEQFLAATGPGEGLAGESGGGLGRQPKSEQSTTPSSAPQVEGTLKGNGLGASSSEQSGGSLDRVGERGLEAAEKRGVLAPILLLLSVVGGGAALYFLRGESESDVAQVLVEEISGNLLSNASFEGSEALTWETSLGSAGAFEVGAPFARSGALGLGIWLEEAAPSGPDSSQDSKGTAGDAPWSYCSGPLLPVSDGRGLDLRAYLQTGAGAVGRLGLTFEDSRGENASFVAWSRGVKPADEFASLNLLATVPPGYDRVAVAVAARGPGWVSLDDVALLNATAPNPLASSESMSAHGYGADGATLTLVRSGRTLIPAISFGNWGPVGIAGSSMGSWGAETTDKGLTLTHTGADRLAELHLVVQSESDEGAGAEGMLASLGPGGYRSHAAQFEIDAMTDLLLGRGYDLLRLSLGDPVRARGRVRAGLLTLVLSPLDSGAGLGSLGLQSSFSAERAAARQLQADAEAASQAGKPGQALAHWQRLLDEAPFEAPLAKRAESERARLIQSGLESVEDLRRDVERARFFGLADLYRQGYRRARELEGTFAGSEVAREAELVSQEILAALWELPNGFEDARRQRLEGVLNALKDSESPDFRAYVQQALAELSPVDSGAGSLHSNHDSAAGHGGND